MMSAARSTTAVVPVTVRSSTKRSSNSQAPGGPTTGARRFSVGGSSSPAFSGNPSREPRRAEIADRMDPAPEVSVIIPTRNRWHILSRSALPAALMQEDVSLEVVVVDDGSSDETQRGLANLSNSGVKVVRNQVSRGVSAARNKGIEAACGEWLAFLDDDDIWAPRKLCSQIAIAQREGAGFAFSAAVTVDEDRRPIAYRGVPEDADPGRLFRTNVVPGGCSNVVARADLVRLVGGFDEHLSMIADWDLWLRLALAAHGAPCPEIHVGYQTHEGNMALQTSGDVFRESGYFAEKHQRSGSGRCAVDRLVPARWVAWENHSAGRSTRAARILLRGGVAERSWVDISRGLRFLVWGSAPAWFSRALWRLRHARDAEALRSKPELPRPEWLDRYETVAFRGGRAG